MSAGTNSRQAQIDALAEDFAEVRRGLPDEFVEIMRGFFVDRDAYEEPLQRWESEGGAPG